jgi:PEP-CTERM motif
MKRLLLASAMLAATIGLASAQSTIQINIFEDGTSIAFATSVGGGSASINTGTPDFSQITVGTTGNPLTPFPDFGTTNTSVSTNFLNGPHTLLILATQFGIPPSNPVSEAFLNTFTTNTLVGGANVASVTFGNFVDPLNTPFAETQSIGTSTFFSSGILSNLPGVGNGLNGPLFSETMALQLVFNGGISQVQSTDQISAGVAGVPEPSTWAMMLIGFAGLGFAFRQSRRKVSFA